MLPNAAVEAVLVRQGKPLNQVEPGSLDNLVKIGFAPFKVNLEDKYLKVQVNPVANIFRTWCRRNSTTGIKR